MLLPGAVSRPCALLPAKATLEQAEQAEDAAPAGALDAGRSEGWQPSFGHGDLGAVPAGGGDASPEGAPSDWSGAVRPDAAPAALEAGQPLRVETPEQNSSEVLPVRNRPDSATLHSEVRMDVGTCGAPSCCIIFLPWCFVSV